MRRLNFHHLFYFWTVAREGSISRASRALHLSAPTLSGQIRALEGELGEPLFVREGRGLQLTDVGRLVQRYAEEIFTLGRELEESVRGRPTGRPLRLVVGIADVVPKRVAIRLLEPALALPEPVHVVCREGRVDRLLGDLASHALDLVLCDAPPGAGSRVKAFQHLLGECGIVFCAAPSLAARLRRGFPKSLDGAPVLLPGEATTLRRSLDQWFETRRLSPRIVGEFDDSALLKAFGARGAGVFAVPDVIEAEVRREYGARVIGRAADLRERFYALTVQRRLTHPAVLAIHANARAELFG